jgi:hypothetical protein
MATKAQNAKRATSKQRPLLPTAEAPPAQPEPAEERKPDDPVKCPYCQEPCTVDRSDPYFLRHVCPPCRFELKVPRPNLVARVRRARAEEQDYSAR